MSDSSRNTERRHKALSGRLRRLSFGAAAVVLSALAVAPLRAQSDAVPWWSGEPPRAEEVQEQLKEALELYALERSEEYLEATETGEDSEHIFLLQERIDRGDYSVEKLFLVGDATFEHAFRRRDGYGAGARPLLQRVHGGAAGGLDGFSCAGCHAQGGLNGAGSATATAFYFGDGAHTSSALLRNPPAVLGLGYVQQLGREMTAELQRQRDQAVAQAAQQERPVEVKLSSKGVDFGAITARADGSLDLSALEGVDADLVVKPFGWKGHTASLRRFGERAARIHFGIQSHSLALAHRHDPDPGLLGGSAVWFDPDADGKAREMEDGTLTALAIYMALLEVPVSMPPRDPTLRERWARGSELFDRIGCSDCHKRSLPIARQQVIERGDTASGEGVSLHLERDGEEPRAEGGQVMLYSDLRRHDMGPELSDPRGTTDGIPPSHWITRPLWGVAESSPYLHDGRAATLPEAILAHDGEASSQRASFEALDRDQQQDVHLFLLSLSRKPKLLVAR